MGLPSKQSTATFPLLPVLTPAHMNWFARHKRLTLVATFVLLMAAVIVFVLAQPDELSRYKARLAASGEELSLAKLLPAYSPESVEYQQQLSDATARLALSPIPPAEIALMEKTTNGLARAAWSRPTPSKPVRGTWEDFAHQVDDSEAALHELGVLLDAPVAGGVHNPTSLFTSKPAFDFISRRKSAQMLAAAVINELHRERLAAAVTNLHRLISLARFSNEGDLLVGKMIQVAIAGMAASATWEALQASGWNDAHFASLQSAWQRLDLARDFSRTVEMERAFAVACYHQFRTNINDRRQMVSLSGSGGRGADALYENLYLPLWAAAWSKGDELHFLETMQPLVEAVRQAATNGSYHLMRGAFASTMGSFKSNQTVIDRLRFPIASTLVPNWEKAAITLLRYETQRQMVLTVLALKRYELQHGRLPAALASLIPDFLPTLPVDHMNGRQLFYERLADQRFKLRSVGNNALDENGNGDDLIWHEMDTRPPDGTTPEN